MMTDQYEGWRQLLAIWRQNPTKPAMRKAVENAGIKIIETEPLCGFYRYRFHKGDALHPICIFQFEGGDPYTVWVDGEEDETGRMLEKVWHGCAFMPVPEKWYLDKVERGIEWPDLHSFKDEDEPETDAPPPAGHNIKTAEIDPLELWRDKVETLEREAKQYETIGDDNASSRAQGFRSASVNALRTEIDRARETLVRPHLDAQRDINSKHNPLIYRLEALGRNIAKWISQYETKRAREEAAQRAEEDRKRREEEEAQRKQAEATQTEWVPPQQEPPRVAPRTAVKGAVGRAANLKPEKVITKVTDRQAVLLYWIDDDELFALALKKHARVLNTTNEVPPGIEFEERIKAA